MLSVITVYVSDFALSKSFRVFIYYGMLLHCYSNHHPLLPCNNSRNKPYGKLVNAPVNCDVPEISVTSFKLISNSDILKWRLVNDYRTEQTIAKHVLIKELNYVRHLAENIIGILDR